MLCRRCFRASILRHARWYSATAEVAPPPVLAKMRLDLKTAMKAKDSTRLDVLRSIISEVNNASKTSKPVTTDLQILSILRKKIAGAREAASQFAEANRQDLKEKQEAESVVLDEYVGQVETVSDEVIEREVKAIVDRGAKNIGIIMKFLTGTGGGLAGMPVESSKIAEVAKRLLSG